MFFLFGLFRADFSQHVQNPETIDFYNGKRLKIEGIVIGSDVRRDKANYTLKIISVNELKNVTGDVLISLPRYPIYEYGDLLQIDGQLEEPGVFDGFSYKDYLSRYGIYSVMYRPKVELIEHGHGSLFWRAMFFMQDGFLGRINRLFPEPHASFEAGLLVGARKGISPDLIEKFNITGLTHIIAISGYNITIIIAAVLWMLKKLPRKVAFYLAIAAVTLFTLFVGASPSVVRASIMGILGLVALNTGRQSNIHLIVLFTAVFMVFWNPKILWFDVGFQLSFLAVLGLIYVAPLFKKYSEKLPEAFGVREGIIMTLSAQVTALPIIVYNFGRLSLIAPLANILVAFAIPLAMLFGFLAVASSFLFMSLGMLFAYVAWGVLTYIIAVIEGLAWVPYASLDVPKIPAWSVAVYYVALIGFLVWRERRAAPNDDPV